MSNEITEQELEQLPENGGFDMRVEMLPNGNRRVWPVVRPHKAMLITDDTLMVCDSYGSRWMVGEVDGVRMKTRLGP